MIAAIDQKLTEQVNRILHNAEFQKLEGAWRGLHYMVNNTESDVHLKIRVMDISKQELGKNLKRFKGAAWDQSPLFKKTKESHDAYMKDVLFYTQIAENYYDNYLLGKMRKG